MTARLLLAAAVLVAGGLCLWATFAPRFWLDPRAEEAVPLGRAVEAAPEGRAALAGDLDAHAALPVADPIPAVESRNRRASGVPPPPPDALVAVAGRVVDAQTGKPVAGLTLGFLSSRPRTVTAKTDSDGRFRTHAELASGVVSAAHQPDPATPLYAARWDIEPTAFLAVPPEPEAGSAAQRGSDRALEATDERGEIRISARAPERVLDIDVRMPDGLPADGAAVSLTFGHRDAFGRFQAEGRAYEDADAYGRARFALHGAEAWERSFRLEAEHGGTLASDVLALDPPLAQVPQVIGLHPGSVLRVRARNDEGRPVAGVSLWLSAQDERGAVRGRAGDTDARGEALFTALREGCYTVSAVHPSTGEEIKKEIDLARGAQDAVDLQLSLAGLRLRLAGTVVDELGYPLPGVSVRARAQGEDAVSLTSAEGGRFEFWGKPCDTLLFAAGGGFQDDRYDPELMAVPCGTAGFTVRRLAKLAEQSWALEVLDRETGERVRAARVTLYHGDPKRSFAAQHASTATGGLVQVSFKVRDDGGFAVDAPGYRREQGQLAELVAAGARNGVLRVELEAGFERRVEVRDRLTRRAVSGATISAGASVLASTDAEGRARLAADEWPAALRVEASGYAPLAWDPFAAGFPGDVVWLDPLRAGN